MVEYLRVFGHVGLFFVVRNLAARRAAYRERIWFQGPKPDWFRPREEKIMSTELIILVVVLVILFGGGGGYYWSRRGP